MKAVKLILITAAAALAALCLTGCVTNIGCTYANADKYTAGNLTTEQEVKALDIDWLSGSVTVSHHDLTTVTVTETCSKTLSDEQKVHTWLDGSTLHVRYCKSGVSFNLTNAEKQLEIKLPQGVRLDSLNCDCTSAKTDITDIAADSISVDVTSGHVTLSDCSAGKYAVDATSGDITLTAKGDSEQFKADSTSGKITVTAENIKDIHLNSTSGDTQIAVQKAGSVFADSTSGSHTMSFGAVPEKTDIDTTSGNVTLLLPKDAGFKIETDNASGKFASDFPLIKDGDTYTAGSGENQISVDTVSGDIAVKTAE